MSKVLSLSRSSGQIDLIIQLEVAGLSMNTPQQPDIHTLWIPRNLRLADVDEAALEKGGEWTWIEGREYLVWDSVEEYLATPQFSPMMLWDLASVADGSPEDIMAFTAEWGVLWPPPNNVSWLGPDKEGSQALDEWIEFATKCRNLLLALATIEGGQSFSDDLADYFWSFAPVWGQESMFSMSEDQRLEHWLRRRDEWLSDVRSSRGREVQQEAVSTCLETLLGPEERTFIWDERGRRFERKAGGVRWVAVAHLEKVFAASEPDVYLCSVCGLPYQFEEEERRRRPRAGARAFCSEECRIEAKREANRRSWQENGAKWRPKGSRSRKENEDGETPG